MTFSEHQHPSTPEKPTSLLPDGPEIPPHDKPLMDDLYGVGGDKAMGYLPIISMRQMGEDPDVIAKFSKARGLSTYWREPSFEDPRKSGYVPDDQGALYVFDELALAGLLQQNADILQKQQWPIGPADFVKQVASVNVKSEEQLDLYWLIGRAFDDARFGPERPGRKAKIRAALGRTASRFIP